MHVLHATPATATDFKPVDNSCPFYFLAKHAALLSLKSPNKLMELNATQCKVAPRQPSTEV